jgi:membrane-bound lytic murein transglycosylase D
VPLAVLEKTLKVDRDRLAQLNPAFRPALLSGSRYVPKGYRLRLPAAAKDWTTGLLAQRIDTSNQYVNQPRPRTYRVRRGDALSIIATRYGLSVGELADANNMSTRDTLRAGRLLRLPEQAATRVAAAQAAAAAGEPGAGTAPVVAAASPARPPAPPPEEVSETLADQREEVAAIARTEQPAEPVSASEAEDEGPSLVPGGAVARPSESTDYSVDDDHTIRVAAEETIGHYADWLDTTASHVRQINKLRYGTSIALGRKIKLDFSNVSVEQFEAKRRDYHEQLEAAFFANHRIIGTMVHTVRSGDSLWTMAQGNGQLPVWLVTHYNPDIDFSALRPGQQIVVPKVELVDQG